MKRLDAHGVASVQPVRRLRQLSGSDLAWLAGQGVLFLLAFVLVPRADGGPGRVQVAGSRAAGTTVFGLGVALGLASFVALGRQLVPQPTPIEDGELVDRGPYGVVRHPIYTAVLLMIVGGLARTPSATGVAVALASAAFFDRKSAHEERLLATAYPDYAGYRARVRWKLLPGVR